MTDKVTEDARIKPSATNQTEEVKVYTPEEFDAAYEALCVKMGWCIQFVPQFVKQENGTFSMVLKQAMGRVKMNKKSYVPLTTEN